MNRAQQQRQRQRTPRAACWRRGSIAALALLPALAIAATDAPALTQIIYQGQPRTAEVIEGDVYLQEDLLAFPGEVRMPAITTRQTATSGSVDEPEVATLRLWRRQRLTYAFRAAVPESTRRLLRQGAQVWMKDTRWQFVETTDTGAADLLIKSNARGRCAASLGAPEPGDQASMTLSSGCTLRSMVHELGHVVGMIHEHQRPDRGTHLKLRPDTFDYIRTAYPDLYARVIDNLAPIHINPGQPYAMDPTSIMMYGSYPQRSPLREDLMARNLPFYTAPDGSLYEASPARLSSKDIATAEYLGTLIHRIQSLLLHY